MKITKQLRRLYKSSYQSPINKKEDKEWIEEGVALRGKQFYSNWRLDKNISWHNLKEYSMGLIYGILTFEWLRPSCEFMVWRLKPWPIWLPPIYAKDFKRVIRK